MFTTSLRLSTLRILLPISLLAAALQGCGSQDSDVESRLRDRTSPTTGTLALRDEGPSSVILVHLDSDKDQIGLCTQEKTSCLDPATPLVSMTKTSPGYWTSNTPVSLEDNLILHVISLESGGRTILFSAKISANTTENPTEESAPDLSPPANLPKMRPIPRVEVAFDYHGTLSRDSSTAAVIRMVIQSGKLAESKRVRVKGTLINLRNSALKIPLEKDVDVLENKVIDFHVAGLEPETVYRLEGTTVFDIKDGTVSTSVGGPVKHLFHIATTADTPLSKAKRRAVLRGVAESYDWEYGNYQSSKGYANGSWCDRFYTWIASKDFKVSNSYSASSFFRQHRAIQNASKIPGQAPTKSMMADMIRYEGTSQGTHTFMIISYDVATKSLWTVEGNYNNRVMRLKRGVSSSWNHGFLVNSQVR